MSQFSYSADFSVFLRAQRNLLSHNRGTVILLSISLQDLTTFHKSISIPFPCRCHSEKIQAASIKEPGQNAKGGKEDIPFAGLCRFISPSVH